MPDPPEVMQRLARLRVAVRAWQALVPGTDAVIPIGKRSDCAIFRSDLEMLIAEMHRNVMAPERSVCGNPCPGAHWIARPVNPGLANSADDAVCSSCGSKQEKGGPL